MGAVAAIGVIYAIPLVLAAWSIYILRHWHGRWRNVAALPAVIIAADVGILLYAGGYGGGTVAGLNLAALTTMYVLTEIRLANRLAGRMHRGPRSGKES